jgi:Ca2+-binding RTX toxin-like protein
LTPIAGAQNVSYFISDGRPTDNSNWRNQLNLATSNPTDIWNDSGVSGSNNGISSVEEGGWESWLRAKDVISYAIGIGTDLTTSDREELDPVAYDGVNEIDTNGVLVPNMSDLDNVLSDTIPQDPLYGTLQAAAGADEGGHVLSITVDGTTYVYDSINPTRTFTTLHGAIFTVNMNTGEYSYKAPAIITGTYDETIGFAMVDADGDSNSSSLVVTNYPLPPSISETWTGTSGAESHTGTSGNDYIDGQGGNDTLAGGDGNDILKGGAGNDSLLGGGGNDIVLGGEGSDTLVYDSADTMLDGGNVGGDDTLILQNATVLDFTGTISDRINNIEVIDLVSGQYACSITHLSYQDVIGITDANKTLYILGDGSDLVQFASGDGWSKGSATTVGGITYDSYSNSNDSNVHVYVQQQINDSIGP